MALQDDVVFRLRRRGLWLEYASMAWMTVEAVVAIVSGIVASSIALTGFGLDSVIEFFAAAVVVWQLRGTISEEGESRALHLIAITFFALAAYLTIEGITIWSASTGRTSPRPGSWSRRRRSWSCRCSRSSSAAPASCWVTRLWDSGGRLW